MANFNKRKKKVDFKFSHFERYSVDVEIDKNGSYTRMNHNYHTKDGFTTNTLQVLAGNFLPEYLEDVELELTINKDGNIDISILNQHYYESSELKEINKYIKSVDWDGWEFLTFFDIRDNSVNYGAKHGVSYHVCPFEYRLVPMKNCKSSEIFDIVTSPQNLSNMKNIENALKNSI